MDSDRSRRFSQCSMAAAESLYRSMTRALGLVVVEVGVELQRSAVLGPHDLHGLSGQALVLLDLALVELEASDAYDLTHGSGLHDALLGSSARLSAVVPASG